LAFPKFFFIFLLFVLSTACLSPREEGQQSQNVLSKSLIDVYINGQLQSEPGEPYKLNVGDQISLVVNAKDALDLPLEYVFYIQNRVSNMKLLQGFSSNNELGSYTVTEDDVCSYCQLIVGIRNNDGVDYQGFLFGDYERFVRLDVFNGTRPPVVDSLQLFVNGIEQDTSYTGIKVGDVLTLKLNATDPYSLPLEYKFNFAPGCSYARELQAFGPSNTLSGFVVKAEELDCSIISMSIRNNDGIDYSGSLAGDTMYIFAIHADKGVSRPLVNSIDFYVNGVLTNPDLAILHVGDVISMAVHAADSNSLPIEYKFSFYNFGQLDQVLQSFGSSNVLSSYVITERDRSNSSGVYVFLKNNDGVYYNGFADYDFQYFVRIFVAPY